MEKVTTVQINYNRSDSLEVMGKRELIQRYVKKGYHVTDERNGYLTLIRPANVQVTLAHADCSRTYNMGDETLTYYNRSCISDALVEQFRQDISSGKISFEMNPDGTEYQMTQQPCCVGK